MASRITGWILAATLLLSFAPQARPGDTRGHDEHPFPFAEATVAQLQAAMHAGSLTSEQLTRAYIQRILELDQNGPGVNSVIELNPHRPKTENGTSSQQHHM